MAFTNCATSVFAAVIIFAIMGFKVRSFTVRKINLFNTIKSLQAHNAYEACLSGSELGLEGNLTFKNSAVVVCDLQVQ